MGPVVELQSTYVQGAEGVEIAWGYLSGGYPSLILVSSCTLLEDEFYERKCSRGVSMLP